MTPKKKRYQVLSGSLEAEVEAKSHEDAALIAVKAAGDGVSLGVILEVRQLKRRDLRYVATVALLEKHGLLAREKGAGGL